MSATRRGLLSRLVDRAPTTRVSTRVSIVEALRVLVATRVGDSPVRPSYGLPDLTAILHDARDSRTPLARVLRDAIVAHEPRLVGVAVRPARVSDGAQLMISARLAGTAERLELECVLSPEGRLTIRADPRTYEP